MAINEYDQWLGVEMRHLAALEAVAEEGSFGRAARRLGYTQSAVSQQIAQLEKVVGAKLVERPGGPRAVSLTDAGRLLLRHADAIVARLAGAQADMAALQAGGAGPARGRLLPRVGARAWPPLIRPDREGIVGLPFGSRRPPRVLARAWHKDRYRSPAAERFVELARELAAELRSNE